MLYKREVRPAGAGGHMALPAAVVLLPVWLVMNRNRWVGLRRNLAAATAAVMRVKAADMALPVIAMENNKWLQ